MAANPPALLVAIHGFLGAPLRRAFEPEDVLQDTLVLAWRDRAQCEWRGIGSFRRWLLQIARHRICDLADQVATHKRGSGHARRLADIQSHADSASALQAHYAGPMVTTTPSRVAADRELAANLQSALDDLPEKWREVVRLRLFEEMEFEAIADLLGLGIEGARSRFGKGAEAYRRALRKRRVVSQGESNR